MNHPRGGLKCSKKCGILILKNTDHLREKQEMKKHLMRKKVRKQQGVYRWSQGNQQSENKTEHGRERTVTLTLNSFRIDRGKERQFVKSNLTSVHCFHPWGLWVLRARGRRGGKRWHNQLGGSSVARALGFQRSYSLVSGTSELSWPWEEAVRSGQMSSQMMRGLLLRLQWCKIWSPFILISNI